MIDSKYGETQINGTVKRYEYDPENVTFSIEKEEIKFDPFFQLSYTKVK